MQNLFRIGRAVWSVYALATFVIVMFLLFPLVLVASFFGKLRGGNMIYAICRFWSDLMLLLWGIRHRVLYEVPHNPAAQYVFVFNHISYMDIPIILASIRNQHFRILGKAEMGRVPVFGLFYRNAVVMVDRSSAEKRAASAKKLKAIIRKGISVAIAPEGTFNTTGRPLKDFYDGAFKIAIETQTPIKPVMFLDSYDRLSHRSILSLTPGKSRAVYLEEVSVAGLTNKDVPALKAKVHQLMQERLISYGATWIS